MDKYKEQDLQEEAMHLIVTVGEKPKILIFKISLTCGVVFKVMIGFLSVYLVNRINLAHGSCFSR